MSHHLAETEHESTVYHISARYTDAQFNLAVLFSISEEMFHHAHADVVSLAAPAKPSAAVGYRVASVS
jgi:hypothetical protein